MRSTIAVLVFGFTLLCASLALASADTQGIAGMWKGTFTTTIPRRKRSAPLTSRAVWLCSTCCHQCRGTNSGMTMVIIPSGDWRWIRSKYSKRGPNTERYGEESTTSGTHHGRVRLDVSGYRQRRREALARFAAQVADDVKSSGVQKALEPMNAADRKVVHDTVNEIDGVRTVSEGEDQRRRVVILPED